MKAEEFEKFIRTKGLNPVQKIERPKATIFIAETDYENDKPNEFPMGYYQTAYAIATRASEGKMDLMSYLEFDAFHDMDQGFTQAQKRNARINATIEEADEFIKKNIEAGRI